MNKLSEFLLMMLGISADEEEKQQREHERWEKQREIAEKDAKHRKPTRDSSIKQTSKISKSG